MNINEKRWPIQAIPNLSNFKELQKEFNNRNIVLFLGAGISRLIGCKSWIDLANDLLKECYKLKLLNYHEFEVINNYNDQKKKISIAYELLKKNGFENEFHNIFNKSLEPNFDKNKKNIYDLLINISRYFVTTNADECFDKYFLDSDIIYNFDSDSAIYPYQLYHIHGSIKDKDSLVFTAKQYLNRYNNNNFFLKFLDNLFNNYTVLFIGYGLTEFELLDYLTLKSKNYKSKKRHYALMPYYSFEEKIVEYDQLYYDSLNITVIPYAIDAKGYDQLIDIMDQWSNKISYFKGTSIELEELFQKETLSKKDINNILEIVLKNESFLLCFIKLCKNKPAFTIILLPELYKHNFFKNIKEKNYWSLYDFLNIYITYCKQMSSDNNIEFYLNIINEIIDIEKDIKEKDIDDLRICDLLCELIFKLDEKKISTHYLDFIDNLINKNTDNLLISRSFCQIIIPKVLNFENIHKIEDIISLLFSYRISSKHYCKIQFSLNIFFIKSCLEKNSTKIFEILKVRFIEILLNKLSSIPEEYIYFNKIKNYKSLNPIINNSSYIESISNIIIWFIKNNDIDANYLFNKFTTENKTSTKFIYLLENIQIAIKSDEEEYIETYNISEEKIPTSNNFSDLLCEINNIQTSLIKPDVNCLQNLLDRLLSILRNIINYNINDITVIVDFCQFTLNIVSNENNELDKRSINGICKNICNIFIYILEQFFNELQLELYNQIKEVTLNIYRQFHPSDCVNKCAFSYNSTLLNTMEGLCFETLFYIYALSLKLTKSFDSNIKNIFENEINSEMHRTFFTLFGNKFEYFFYYDEDWTKNIISNLIEKEDISVFYSFISGYFYSDYVLNTKSFNYLKAKGFYDKIFDLKLKESECYKTMASIGCITYLNNIEKLEDKNNLIYKILENNDIEYTEELINNFIFNKENIILYNYDKVLPLWQQIEKKLESKEKLQDLFDIKIKLLEFIEFFNVITSDIYEAIQFSIQEIPQYQIEVFFVPKLLEIYKNSKESRSYIEQIIIEFAERNTIFFDFENNFQDLFLLIRENNKKNAEEIANLYFKNNTPKYLDLLNSFN